MNGSLLFGPTIRLCFIPTVFFLPTWQKFEPTLPRARPHVKHYPIKYSQAATSLCFSVTLLRSDLRVLHAFCSSKVSLCYWRISPSFSKMNAFFSALVLCLCFLAVSTAPEKNSATSRMHDGKLSDKEHYDKDGKHNEEYDHEAFLGKEKKSFDQLTPEESKERLG